MFGRNVLLGSSAIITSLLTGLAAPAFAQTEAAPAAQAAAADQQVEAVVVTGSRIRRSPFNSPTPVSVITSEAADLQGVVDTGAILQNSVLGASSQQINNNFTGFVTTGGNGANTLSLRGLGAQRSLTLINGRRAGPAGIGGTVGPFDLNTIPSSLVDRIEIATGGASSVYGSDAISGVVNIFTKKNTDKLDVSVYGNAPFEKGGEQYRASISKGWTFSRGYLTAAGEYFHNDGLQFKDRDYLNCPQDYVFNPTTGERLDLRMADGSIKCLGTLTNIYIRGTSRYIADPTAVANGFDLNGFRRVNATIANLNGDIDPVTAGVQPIYAALIGACAGQNTPATVNDACATARREFARANQALQPTDSKEQGYRHAISPVTRYSAFLTGGFDLTENTHVYGELLLNRRESLQRSMRQVNYTIAAANPTNPFNAANNPAYNNGPYGALTASNAQGIFVLPAVRDQKVDYKRAVVGVNGDLPDSLPVIGGWSWDVYGQYSKSSGEYGQDFVYNDRLAAVTGAAICNQALVTISANAPNATCPTNLNLLKTATVAGSYLTPEEYAFLIGYEKGSTKYIHQYVEGSLTGELFNLPAGAVGAAIGFQLRKEEIDDQPGYNSSNSNYNGSAAAAPTKGEDTIKEVFGEVEVPLVKDVMLVESLTASLSGRYSDYKSYGSSSTYKAGLNWHLTPTWALRASKGTSFRAPALYELYLGSSTSFLAQTSDPCYQYGSAANVTDRQRANCAALGIKPDSTHGSAGSFTIYAKGGLGYLKAEESDSWSAGLVWTPKFADLSIAVDYSEIEINNQVQRYGSANILGDCLDASDFPNNAFCSLITRDMDPNSSKFGAVLTVDDAYLNVAKQWNHALDLNVRYGHGFDFGRLTLTGQFTWQLDWYTQLGEDAVPQKNQGFTAFPDFAGNVGARFDHGDWTVSWAAQLLGKTSDVDDSVSGYGTDIVTYREEKAYVKRHQEFYATHDISVRKKFADDLQVTFGVNNVFNEEPPFYSTSGLSRISSLRLASQYDIIGRRAFLQIDKSW